MSRGLWIIMTLLLCNCGGEGSSSSASGITLPGTRDPVGLIAFSANPVRTESRMVSYAAQAGRLSLIDPDVPSELWGVQAPGYDFAIAFPDLQGATLFGEQNVELISGTDRLAFSLQTSYAQTASATGVLAYALASSAGDAIEVIRYLGSAGQWQHDVLTVPWTNSVTTRPVDQPVLLASLFNAAGTLLMVFRPADGRYTVINAANTSSALLASGRDCAGDGVGTPEAATFRSIAWDEARAVAYVGTRNGHIYAIDPAAGCVALASEPSMVLDNAAINQIAVNAAGELSVLQDNGQLHQVTYDGASFAAGVSYAMPCSYPDGAVSLGSQLHLVTCLAESSSGSGVYDTKNYYTIDLAANTVRATFTLAEKLANNIAIDASRRKMFRVEDNALGVLFVYDLLTGTVLEQRGMFLDNILNSR